ncbi:2Fe-2S iron-sulfur cluster binding domain-containing protein [candidate division KSB1 bacterium]|nr:2Fe-2S iron-sulfur cluster binding domain-containing protein [candidate division KSB1 bacterium]
MKEVTITVDGKELTVPEGALLIDACEQHGIYIPRFCYHSNLTQSGNCRMCLVKIKKNPKPQPACMTPVADGMVVYSDTPEIAEMRKSMLEFLLINHPLDCPICDKAGECMLQDQYMEFSGDKSRFNETKVAKEKLVIFSDRVLYDAERCITCTRCVRFTREVSKTHKLGVVQRGDRSFVSLASGDTLEDPYSLCVTDICPVGALTDRRFRFKERVWNLHTTDSVCAGCSRGCNIHIDTKDNEMYRITARDNKDVNKSWMCDYGRDYMLSVPEQQLSGVKKDHSEIEYKSFVSGVAELLKKNANKFAVMLSSHATNEELALMKQMIDELKIKGVFYKSDRIWNKSTGEVEADDFLINADKTPNLSGVKKIFPQAKDVSEMVISDYKYAIVWGGNAPVEKLDGLELVALSTARDQISDKAKWVIAGRSPVEKHGSFTNCDGVVQSFRKAINGIHNYDDLLFLVELLKKLDIEPLGRTVHEVRATF